jgi:hypothetical protein
MQTYLADHLFRQYPLIELNEHERISGRIVPCWILIQNLWRRGTEFPFQGLHQFRTVYRSDPRGDLDIESRRCRQGFLGDKCKGLSPDPLPFARKLWGELNRGMSISSREPSSTIRLEKVTVI